MEFYCLNCRRKLNTEDVLINTVGQKEQGRAMHSSCKGVVKFL